MPLRFFLLCSIALMIAGCHPNQPIVDAGSKQPPVGGTVAGVVTATDRLVPLSGRKVTVVDTKTGSHYETTTAANGGYTVKVPEGTYRIDVELRSGEALAKRPDETHVNNGDLDPHRNFVITAAGRTR